MDKKRITTWSSSDEDVAVVRGVTTPTLYRGTKPGVTTITASLTNGVTKSFDFELKSLAVIDNRLEEGGIVPVSSYNRTATHVVSELDYGWYYSKETGQHLNRLYLKGKGEKIFDSKGDSNQEIDFAIVVALLDKDGVIINSKSVLSEKVMTGDKHEIKTEFGDAPLSKTPYTLRVKPYNN